MTERTFNSDSAPTQGSGFARGAAGSLLAKPSGRAVNSKSIREYEAELNPLPDYAADPGLWRKRMEHNAHAFLKRKGVVNDQNRSRMVNAALNAAATTKPGDERTAWRSVFRERRALIRRQKAYEAQKAFEKTIERWLVSECMLPSDIVKLLIKQSDIKNTDRSKLTRLVDVTMMSIEQQFNVRRQYAVHFAANALDERVIKLWQRVHEVGERDGWTLQERVSKLNNALGGVAHIYMYPHTPEQALAAFEERFGDGEKPIVPPGGEVKAMANQPTVNEVHWIDVDEARKKFWRDAKGLAAAAGVMDKLQEKFIHAATVNDETGSLHDFKGTPDEALTLVLRAAIRRQLELAYEPDEITTNLIRRILSGPFETALTVLGHMGVLQRIKEHVEKELDGQNGKPEITILDIPKTPTTPANDVKPPELPKPIVPLNGEAAQPLSVNSGLPTIQPIIYGESPCTVYPMDRGSVIYKGIKFSVTLRKPGGTWAMAVELMEEFVAHKELIDASCLAQPVAASNVTPFVQPAVATLPMAVGQTAPVPAPMAPIAGLADSKGRVPGQTGTDAITGVKKVVDNGKTTIELWASGSFAEHRLGREADFNLVAAMGVDVNAMAIGTTYPVNWKADWLVTGKKNQKGTAYYRDVTAIRNG